MDNYLIPIKAIHLDTGVYIFFWKYGQVVEKMIERE